MAILGSTSRAFICTDRLVKKAKFSALLIFLSATPLFATQKFELEREDGTHLIGYYDKPQGQSFSLVLLLPGSQKETARRLYESLKEDLLAMHQCPLTIEKQGIDGDQIDEKVFTLSLSHQQRLDDHLQLLEALHQGIIPEWDGRLTIIGQGDGGRIGAALAAQQENTTALILIAAGGGWPPLEETLYAFRTEMADEGYSPQYIHGFLVQAKQEFAQALKNPKADRKAFGYTYKYWASLLKTSLIEDLSKIHCPIYTINGAKDERVPIESVDALAKHLKGKITLNRKDQAGREIIQDKKIYEEAISWLKKRTLE